MFGTNALDGLFQKLAAAHLAEGAVLVYGAEQQSRCSDPTLPFDLWAFWQLNGKARVRTD